MTEAVQDQHTSPVEDTYAMRDPHTKVKYLIYHDKHPDRGEIFVYIDHELDLEWECDSKASSRNEANGLVPAIRQTWNGIADLEPIAHNWPDDLKLTTKRRLGEAMASVLKGDQDGAKQALSNAKSFIKSKSKQVSRFWTLQSCLLAGGIAALIGIVSVFSRTDLISWFGKTPFLLSLCFFAGCVGALLFVIMRLGKQPNVDSTAERHLHYIEGVSRVVAGGIAGILVGGMVKLGLILPIFTQAGMESLSMCIAAMIAGASERMAAGIITKVENNEPTNQEATNANN